MPPMRRLAPLLSIALAGCNGGWWLPVVPDWRGPAARAREMAPRCTHESESKAAAAMAPDLVESVEPAYSTVPSGNDRVIRLRGAKLHLRPTLNVSAEALARTLECHQVRVTLGQDAEVASDPYVLRGTWLDIDVDSSGDGLVASVRVDRFEDARRVLGRASAFATARP